MIQQIIEYNREFVKKESYKPYITSKYPDKKLAILTCMDTRLTNFCRQHLVSGMEMLKSSKMLAVSLPIPMEVLSAVFWLHS